MSAYRNARRGGRQFTCASPSLMGDTLGKLGKALGTRLALRRNMTPRFAEEARMGTVYQLHGSTANAFSVTLARRGRVALGVGLQHPASQRLKLDLLEKRDLPRLLPRADAPLVNAKHVRDGLLATEVAPNIEVVHVGHYGNCHMAMHIDSSNGQSSIGGMETIGERLKRIRKAEGFPRQSDLADKIGADQSTISDIENNKGFSAEMLMKLARALLVSPSYLMTGVEDTFELTDDERRWIRISRKAETEKAEEAKSQPKEKSALRSPKGGGDAVQDKRSTGRATG